MSEKVAEVSLPPVKVPADLKRIIDELKFLELKGDKLRLYNTSDIMREALLKGLQLMLLERDIYNKLMKMKAVEGAKRIYTSLNELPVEKETQATTGVREALEETGVSKMSEEETEEEEEEEEE